jgi:glycosyltransferase involved in cell wall biosynthesis
MSERLPISAFIIAVNEADRIGAAIESVRAWVDEVVIIDSGSSDNTVAVCESYGARVVYNAWQGYGQQKRFGEEQCRHHWILNIDADEVVSATLRQKIQSLFSGQEEPRAKGFFIPIIEILPGRKNPLPLAHRITAVRLYDKNYGRFADSTVHDTVRMERGENETLAEIIEHRSSRNVAHSIQKLNHYSICS